MDLKIKDVAELLNVSETTVRRWLGDGKIPAYKIHGQYRFSRIEIENWVLQHKLGHIDGSSPFNTQPEKPAAPPMQSGGSQKFSLYRALHKGQILHHVPGGTKEEVIKRSTKLLSQSLNVDGDILAELLIDRERQQPTALNNGIAIPHTRDFLLSPTHDVMAIVFPEKPIQYGALDGLPVHTLFFLFACNDKRHLHLLAKVAHLSHQPHTLNLLQEQPPKEKLLEYVHAWESSVPDPNED